MTERLVKIVLGDDIFQNILLENFRYSSSSLELIVSLENCGEYIKVKILFDWVYSFRVTDEGDLLKMQDEQKGEMLTGLYFVEESQYLEWFNEQSANIHDDVVHYMLATVDDVIDILSSVEPSIELIEDI